MRWTVIVPAMAAVLIAIVAGSMYVYAPRTFALTDRDTIVLADFSNTTGDPVFDGMLAAGVVSAARAVAIPQPRLGPAYPAALAADGAAR